MKDKKLILIDTDLGDDIDDAFALCLAMCSPEIELLGVTTVFRCASHRAKMAKALLRAGGFGNVPVHAGRSRPLACTTVHGREIDYGEAPKSYAEEYEDVLYDGDDAPDFLIEVLERSARKITIVTLGALTNIALVLQRRPDLYAKIECITIMGGAFSMNWGEYNFCCDPDAAAFVLDSGLPIRCVGVDVTFCCKLSGELLDRVQTHPHPCLRMLGRMRKKWGGEVYLHDPLALMCAFDDRFVKWQPMVCAVESGGKYANGYVINLSDPNWRRDAAHSNLLVATSVDAEAFTREYVRRVSGFPGGDRRKDEERHCVGHGMFDLGSVDV